jgi:dCMP deaminase
MTFAFNDPRMWDWAVGMARHVALLSKDPSTKVGAVIFDGKKRIVSAGYNGLPRGVSDTQERLTNRDIKYKMILHAEVNALSFATAPVEGATLFCTHPCCTQCAAQIIQRGVAHVCWPTPDVTFFSRWAYDMDLSAKMFEEAGVTIHVR